MKKIKVYRWNTYVNVADDKGRIRRQLLHNDSIDMIEAMFNNIPSDKRPTGTKNYQFIRDFLKATKSSKQRMKKMKEDHNDDEERKRKEFQRLIEERNKNGNPIDRDDLNEFEMQFVIQDEIVLDDEIYNFIKNEGFDKFLSSNSAFDELTANAIDAYLNADDYTHNPDKSEYS